jgi:hypothetical protein
MPEPRNQEVFLKLEQFAQKLDVGRSTVHEWIRIGRLVPGIHFIKIGRVIRFLWGDELIQRLLEDSAVGSYAPTARNSTKSVPRSYSKETVINLDY